MRVVHLCRWLIKFVFLLNFGDLVFLEWKYIVLCALVFLRHYAVKSM